MFKSSMKLKDIKIKKGFLKTEINSKKLENKRNHYEATGEFKEKIVINKNGYLIDGYSTYLLAKEKGMKDIPKKYILTV